jgi:hypothetical protein
VALPPAPLITAPVKFTMVKSADGDGELVADFASHRAWFGKFDMVGIRWAAATDHTRLRGDEPQMIPIAIANGLAQ